MTVHDERMAYLPSILSSPLLQDKIPGFVARILLLAGLLATKSAAFLLGNCIYGGCGGKGGR